MSETIGKTHPKINIRTLTKAHITNVKARILGDATAALASGDDNDNHEAKLSADLPRCSLTLLGSPVDVKACNPSIVSVALTPGGKDNDNDNEEELSVYLLCSSLPLVGFPALPQTTPASHCRPPHSHVCLLWIGHSARRRRQFDADWSNA